MSFSGLPISVKVASSQAILASSGALQNLTQLLPPPLATYIDATIGQLSEALAGSNEYLAARGLSPTILYSTIACAALIVPFGMSRYGGAWGAGRDGLSPFASQTDSQGDPVVTDEDFSYITSQDLEGSLQSPQRAYDPQGRQPPPNSAVDDDILLVKNKGVTYPVHFPAYSIGDGKLTVRDVRDRVGLVMDITDRRQQRRIKMLYKGRHLKDSSAPIRDYGAKNNSEILVVMPEGSLSGESSETSEEVIVTDSRDGQTKSKKSKSRNKRKKKERESSVNLDVPQSDTGRRSPAEDSRQPSRVPSPAASPALEKLQEIRSHFNTKLLPLCVEFSANPPKDKKKCEDEHRKLSETVLQQVLLKLDEVETGGDLEIRAKRKELVNMVQDVLKGIDKLLPEGSVKPSLY